jgi:hypothetical protein
MLGWILEQLPHQILNRRIFLHVERSPSESLRLENIPFETDTFQKLFFLLRFGGTQPLFSFIFYINRAYNILYTSVLVEYTLVYFLKQLLF